MKLQKSGLFKLIIAANQHPMGLSPDHQEKLKPGLLHMGAGVYQVPFFAQGFLISADVAKNKAQALEDLLAGDQKTMTKKDIGFLADKPQVAVWLDKSYQDENPLKKEFQDFRQGLSKEYNANALRKRPFLSENKYVGAKVCAGCHQAAYQVWEKSKHANAHITLANKNQHKNLECLECHVAGLKDKKSGFVSEKDTPHLSGVQCENCHGPRKDHISNPHDKKFQYKIVDSKNVCIGCHHSPHSPDFNYLEYWGRVKHK